MYSTIFAKRANDQARVYFSFFGLSRINDLLGCYKVTDRLCKAYKNS